jgi:hypothetical protein
MEKDELRPTIVLEPGKSIHVDIEIPLHDGEDPGLLTDACDD